MRAREMYGMEQTMSAQNQDDDDDDNVDYEDNQE